MTQKLSGEEIYARRAVVVAAASRVFLRYGYARTTMQDLADAAKLSRPALYVMFPKKDDIFEAVIERLHEEKMSVLRAALPRLRSLERKLHLCCESWGAHGVDLMEVHPDAKDLFDLAFPAVQRMYADFTAFLAALLRDPVAASKLKATPEDLARNLVFAMRGFKDAASDGAQMRQMIALEVDTLVAAVGNR